MSRLLVLLASLIVAAGPAHAQERAANQLPTIFIAGDSTAARGAGERQQGWGEPFAAHFDASKVNIVNLARGGRSSRTLITEGLCAKLSAEVVAGALRAMPSNPLAPYVVP